MSWHNDELFKAYQNGSNTSKDFKVVGEVMGVRFVISPFVPTDGFMLHSNMKPWDILEDGNRWSVYSFGQWKATFADKSDAESYIELKS